MFSKSKDKEKFVILQSIGMIWIKIKETRVAANTSRYSSGLLIPNSAATVWNIGINCLLEYLQVLATTLVSLHFIYMIPIDCKITYFSLYIPVMYINIYTYIYLQQHVFWKQGVIPMPNMVEGMVENTIMILHNHPQFLSVLFR